MVPHFSHNKFWPTNLYFFWHIVLSDLKLKFKLTNKRRHYQYKCLFILRFWHRRHFYCLKLFETYQKMKVNMKYQRYEWPDKYYKKNKQAPLIPDLPEKCWHRTNDMWHVTHNMNRMSQSISELMRKVLVKQLWQKRVS